MSTVGDGTTCEISITSASENDTREVSPLNPPTVPLNEVCYTLRKNERAAGGELVGVQRSVTNHLEIDSAWGAWHERLKAVLQHRNEVEEDQLLAKYFADGAPTPASHAMQD